MPANSRGRPPVPTKLKLVRGTAQPSRVLDDEATFDTAAPPDPPAYLSKEAKKYWPDACKMLFDAGVMTVADVTALAGYCTYLARWVKEMRAVEREGSVVRGSRGPIMNPHYRAANEAFDRMNKIMADFGMNPSARTRVPGHKPEGKKKKTGFAGIDG